MSRKRFGLDPKDFRPIAVGRGSCYASDRITVDGCKVGYMYREEPDGPDHPTDSGWRFFSGDESDEYACEANNFAIYDVNTIANYDPDIALFLDAPFGTAFARGDDGVFVQEEFHPPTDH